MTIVDACTVGCVCDGCQKCVLWHFIIFDIHMKLLGEIAGRSYWMFEVWELDMQIDLSVAAYHCGISFFARLGLVIHVSWNVHVGKYLKVATLFSCSSTHICTADCRSGGLNSYRRASVKVEPRICLIESRDVCVCAHNLPHVELCIDYDATPKHSLAIKHVLHTIRNTSDRKCIVLCAPETASLILNQCNDY